MNSVGGTGRGTNGVHQKARAACTAFTRTPCTWRGAAPGWCRTRAGPPPSQSRRPPTLRVVLLIVRRRAPCRGTGSSPWERLPLARAGTLLAPPSRTSRAPTCRRGAGRGNHARPHPSHNAASAALRAALAAPRWRRSHLSRHLDRALASRSSPIRANRSASRTSSRATRGKRISFWKFPTCGRRLSVYRRWPLARASDRLRHVRRWAARVHTARRAKGERSPPLQRRRRPTADGRRPTADGRRQTADGRRHTA